MVYYLIYLMNDYNVSCIRYRDYYSSEIESHIKTVSVSNRHNMVLFFIAIIELQLNCDMNMRKNSIVP